MGDLLGGRQGGEGSRQAGRTGAGGGHGGRCVCSARSAPALSPPSAANTEKPLPTCRAGRLPGRRKRQHRAIGRDLRPVPPSPLKVTPRSHAVLHGLGMTHRSTSPLVSISFSFPISTESSPVYLLPLLPAIVAVCCISSCIQGGESSAAGAAFKGVVRSVLPRDGAAVQELTFRVFTSDLPHAVIISHATKTISWNDSGPMASTVAA